MPLRAAQLFVRCRSLEELGEALDRSLQKMGRPPDELALLGLHESQWGTIVADRLEPALARHMSERFGTALAVQLDGGELALTVQTFEGGAPGDVERDPGPPRFRDVEAAAWELLEYLGVPPALRLLAFAEIEVLRDAGAGLPAVLARAGPERVEMWTVSAVPPPREEGPHPPAVPDVVVASQAGEARAIEVRTLPGGIPTDAWAQALAAVEEAQARRLLRVLADFDEPRMPRPAFAYRSLQALRVEKLLAKARRERPWLWRLLDPEREPPLTRAGFTLFCRERLGDLPVARAHGRNLEVRASAACVRAPVEKVYQIYLSTLDADAAAAQLVAETRALIEKPPPGLSVEHFLPTLLAGDPGGRAVRQLAPGLFAALLADDGDRIAPVLAADLADLGLDLDAAFERAVARAACLTEAAPEGIRWLDLEHGRVVIFDFPDAGAAGRLLCPHARELILRILGEEHALAAAPTRDALLACGASDDDGAAWLAEEARRRFEEGPFPIHAGLWKIGAGFLQPAAQGDSGVAI